MGSVHDAIDDRLAAWIAGQRVFFVGTAPLATDGHINLSPKGGTVHVLGPRRVAYADVTGSGAEGIAHLRENGRIVVMLCAFDGPPRILRLHGRGRVVLPDDSAWAGLIPAVGLRTGQRAIIDVAVERVSTSCGMGVPRYQHLDDRRELDVWATRQGEDGLAAYREKKNRLSIDGLAAYPGTGTP